MKNEKRAMTTIGNISVIEKAYEKLILKQELSYDEKTILLSTALIMLKEYELDNNCQMFFDMGYEIIARYSIQYNDYSPLFDFSLNYGFFPITDYLAQHHSESLSSICGVIQSASLSKFRLQNYLPTLHQYNCYNQLLNDGSKSKSYIAPTSFGKSDLIIAHIKKKLDKKTKAAIIVPTKSLLSQTYKTVKDNIPNIKIILHDEMYSGEDNFIAVLTQERALRLIENHNVTFDFLYIDEAHNIFEKDSRNRLLARLVRCVKQKNTSCEILYFSPLVNNSNNLRVLGENEISQYRIENNIKIPVYYLFDKNGKRVYNRYFNKYYDLPSPYSNAFAYIRAESSEKNMLYINAPKRMEEIAELFGLKLDTCRSKELDEMVKSVETHVHKSFLMIPLIKRGIVYLHGKLPDYVKEYIEYKAAKMAEIKYICANSVLLEGINLPITSMFILDARGLTTNKLINLTGRVNRLNSIFGSNTDINRLFPPIHFVENTFSQTIMRTYVERLRVNKVTDELKNPFLENFDIDKEPFDQREKLEKIYQDEERYFSNPNTQVGKMYRRLVALAINSHIELSSEIVTEIFNRIELSKSDPAFLEKSTVQKVVDIFLKDIPVIDFELDRLKNQQAISYYENYIDSVRQRTLQQNIIYEYKYFLKRKEGDDPLIYMGSSYGDVSKPTALSSGKVYVDLRGKNDDQLINLAIIKLKIEDDFLSYKFEKFIEVLHDYELISDDEYNFTTYGTSSEFEVKLVKQGLPIHLVTKLQKDDQLKNLFFDDYNFIHANSEFKKYYNDMDDFYQYQINKYIYS